MNLHVTNRRGAISVFQALFLGPIPLAAATWFQDWYVDVNAPSCATGTGTQADPFCDVMDAVAAAADGDTIHIAPGTYFENVILDKDLSLIGTGGEQVTIIDGSLAGTVVEVDPLATVGIEGLTLTNGTAGLRVSDGFFPYDSLPRVSLTSCTLSGNSSGAQFWSQEYAGSGALALERCSVLSNSPLGGIDGLGEMSLDRCVVAFNVGNAGGIASGGVLTLANSSVVRNVSTDCAIGAISSGIGVWGATSVSLTNSTVAWNVATKSNCFGYGDAAAIVVDAGYGQATLSLTNSIVAGNAALGTGRADSLACLASGGRFGQGTCTAIVTHSLVEGGWPGAGNLDADPLFLDAPNGDLRLLQASPCIDAGDNTAVPNGVLTDIRGFQRFFDDPFTPDTGVGPAPVVDKGAFEFGHRNRIRPR